MSSLYPNPLPEAITGNVTPGHVSHSQRLNNAFNDRPLFLGDSDFAVDLTGTNDSTAAFQAAVDRATTGVAIEVPPQAKIRIDGTIDLGSGTGSAVPRRNLKVFSHGGHGRNEGSPGFQPVIFKPTAGTLFTMSGQAANQIDQWGPTFEGLSFRDTTNSGAGGSATLFDLKLINRFTFEECAFLFARVAVNLDSLDDVVAGGDSAWGEFRNCIWYECGWGIKSRRTYGHHVIGGQAYRCGRVDGVDATGATFDFDARTQGWRVIGTKIDSHRSLVPSHVGVRDLGSSNEYCLVHIEKATVGFLLDGDPAVTGPPSGHWRAVVGCTVVGDGTGVGVELTANSGHTNLLGNNLHSLTTKVADNSPNAATSVDQENNVKVGQTHSTPGTPANGVWLYVDSTGNLLAKTKAGNVRTVAAV